MHTGESSPWKEDISRQVRSFGRAPTACLGYHPELAGKKPEFPAVKHSHERSAGKKPRFPAVQHFRNRSAGKKPRFPAVRSKAAKKEDDRPAILLS
ncbi:MAG: hypothetical protein IKH93_07795 [Bacteroidales bacterium]|nr:hypothetical protein [Bacteroidales bacterium]